MPTIEHYATPLKLPMTIDLFSRFPALAGYRAELKGGHVELTYRPRSSLVRLGIAPRGAREVAGVAFNRIDVRSGQSSLAKLFALSFAHVPPLDTMAATTRRHAADAAMKHTATGGDGALVDEACFGAIDSSTHRPIAAVIVTEIALHEDDWPGDETPPLLPNLTWLFVSPEHQRGGIGSALLDRVVNALAARERPWLISHVAPHNVPSLMFHWRSAFELVPMRVSAYDGTRTLKKV